MTKNKGLAPHSRRPPFPQCVLFASFSELFGGVATELTSTVKKGPSFFLMDIYCGNLNVTIPLRQECGLPKAVGAQAHCWWSAFWACVTKQDPKMVVCSPFKQQSRKAVPSLKQHIHLFHLLQNVVLRPWARESSLKNNNDKTGANTARNG